MNELDPEKKSLKKISMDLTLVADKAHKNNLTLDDISGASITISSLGGIGGTYFTPMWAYTLISYVPDNWKFAIFDQKFDKLEDIGHSDIFAFSGKNQDINSMKSVHMKLKEKYPSSTYIVGGPVTWSLEQERALDVLGCFDHHARGFWAGILGTLREPSQV